MNDTRTPVGDWDTIRAELRAYQEQQKKTWGDINDIAVAKYLSGLCTADEQHAVEKAAATYPAIRELVDQVRQALTAAGIETAQVTAPMLWRVAGHAAELMGRLATWVDESGRLLAAGLESWIATPQPAFGRCMGREAVPGEPPEAAWEIPLPDEVPGRLTLAVRPAEKPGDWFVSCKLLSQDGGALPSARLEITTESGKVELAGWLDNDLNEPIRLRAGEWHITIEIQGHTQHIHMAMGVPPSP